MRDAILMSSSEGRSYGTHSRKLCRAQQSSTTRSRTPFFHRRTRSLTIRQRLTLLQNEPGLSVALAGARSAVTISEAARGSGFLHSVQPGATDMPPVVTPDTAEGETEGPLTAWRARPLARVAALA